MDLNGYCLVGWVLRVLMVLVLWVLERVGGQRVLSRIGTELSTLFLRITSRLETGGIVGGTKYINWKGITTGDLLHDWY